MQQARLSARGQSKDMPFCPERWKCLRPSSFQCPKKTLEVASVFFARELSFVALTIVYAYLFCLNYFIYYSLVYILKLHGLFCMEIFAAIKPFEVSVLFARELYFVALTIAYAYLFCLNYILFVLFMLFIIR